MSFSVMAEHQGDVMFPMEPQDFDQLFVFSEYGEFLLETGDIEPAAKKLRLDPALNGPSSDLFATESLQSSQVDSNLDITFSIPNGEDFLPLVFSEPAEKVQDFTTRQPVPNLNQQQLLRLQILQKKRALEQQQKLIQQQSLLLQQELLILGEQEDLEVRAPIIGKASNATIEAVVGGSAEAVWNDLPADVSVPSLEAPSFPIKEASTSVDLFGNDPFSGAEACTVSSMLANFPDISSVSGGTSWQDACREVTSVGTPEDYALIVPNMAKHIAADSFQVSENGRIDKVIPCTIPEKLRVEEMSRTGPSESRRRERTGGCCESCPPTCGETPEATNSSGSASGSGRTGGSESLLYSRSSPSSHDSGFAGPSTLKGGQQLALSDSESDLQQQAEGASGMLTLGTQFWNICKSVEKFTGREIGCSDFLLTGKANFETPAAISAVTPLEQTGPGSSLADRLAEIVRKQKVTSQGTVARVKKDPKPGIQNAAHFIKSFVNRGRGDGQLGSATVQSFSPSTFKPINMSIPRPLGSSAKEAILRSLGVDIPSDPKGLLWLNPEESEDVKDLAMQSFVPASVLYSAVLSLAESLATDETGRASLLTTFLKVESSPKGSPMQRVAFSFLEGLVARRENTGVGHYVSPMSFDSMTETSLWRFVRRMPCLIFWMEATVRAILEAVEGETHIHIVDFSIWTGLWGPVLQKLASRPNPPHVRFTAVTAPAGTPTGLGPVCKQAHLRAELSAIAEMSKLPFEIEVLSVEMSELKGEMLKLKAEEALVVNCGVRLSQLLDRGTARWNPRDAVLQTLRDLNPCILTMGEIEFDTNVPFFLARVKSALDVYGALFDTHEVLADRSDIGREAFEKKIFGREIMNILSCEGAQRVVRHENLKSWKQRMGRLGFTIRATDEQRRAAIEKSIYVRGSGFAVQNVKGILVLTLGGRPIGFAGAWQPFLRALPL